MEMLKRFVLIGVIASTPFSVVGCASTPEVVVEYRTETVEVPVRIPVPPALLEHPDECFFPPAGKLYIFDIDEWLSCASNALKRYRETLDSIRTLQTTPPTAI